jgi:5-methylcytosine-specific restriction endonuclease McrA
MEHPTPHRQVEFSNIGEGDKAVALHYFDNKCCYCGIKLTRVYGFDNSLEMEHYISVSEQSEDINLVIDGSVQNRVPSCRRCNRRKSDRQPEEWIRGTFENAEEIIYNIEFFFSQQGDKF